MVGLVALQLTLAVGVDGTPRGARLLAQVDAPPPTLAPEQHRSRAPWPARLLAQVDAPPSVLVPEPPPARAAVLEADVAALNRRIAAIDVHWPTGALIASYAGAIVVYAVLVTSVAVFTSLSTPAPLIVLVALGVAGAGLLIAGLVAGMSAAAAARADRDALIRERDQLKRELDELRARPDVVHIPFAPSPTLTLARF